MPSRSLDWRVPRLRCLSVGAGHQLHHYRSGHLASRAPTAYGLAPLTYTIVAIVVALLIDQVHDNLVSPPPDGARH